MRNLAAIMKKKNLSGYKLAQMSGVSTSHMSDIINGRKEPGLRITKQIATALGVTVGELIGEKPKKGGAA